MLRRPPRPPLPPSAHDVVREARLQLALREAAFARLPEILAVCEDESLLGVPFYVMAYLDGVVPTDELPAALEGEAGRRALGEELVDALVEIHAADVTTPVARRVRAAGELQRAAGTAVRAALGINQTRELAVVDDVGAALAAAVPSRSRRLSVHGDFRLGNTMVAHDAPARILAVLDWEMGAVGDPRADVGYLLATYTRARRPAKPARHLADHRASRLPHARDLVERYVAASGRDVEPLAWFEALALWKAAVFCEAIYGRYVRGELGAEDTRAARFEEGVPYLAEAAASALARDWPRSS